MRTVPFQSVLHGTARLLGMDPWRDLTTARAATLTEHLNQRLAEGWRFDFWPEWTVVEQRTYRPPWSGSSTYPAGVEVYDPPSQAYYLSLRAGNTANPPTSNPPSNDVNLAWWALATRTFNANDWAAGTAYALGDQVRNPADGEYYQCTSAHTAGATFDATQFGPLTAFDPYVAYEQPGQTPLDQIRRVTRKSPRVFGNSPGEVGFFVSDQGVQMLGQIPPQIWLEFRLRPPVFDSTPWSAGESVTAGVVRYYAGTGECYLALASGSGGASPAAQPALWQKLNFPLTLANWTKRAAAADALRGLQQTDRALALLAEAQTELEDAHDREFAGQSQFDTAQVQTYGRDSLYGSYWAAGQAAFNT